MTLEEQIKVYKEIAAQIEKLEGEKKALGVSILQQMQEKRMQVAGYTVHRYERLSIQLSIEEARAFGATRQEEIIDREKIKALYQEGRQISGVSKIPYLVINAAKNRIN